VSGPPAAVRRVIGRALRTPAALDRPGLRWLMDGMSPAQIVVLVHRGRRTGKTYRTPVEAIAEYPERGEIVISPLWAEKSDWYRNVVAGGLEEVRLDGEGHEFEWRPLSEDEKREAIATYRREHPVYSRVILRTLVSVHGLSGDHEEAVAQSLPMLALHRPAAGR